MKDFTTSKGTKLELKDFITGKDWKSYQQLAASRMTISLDQDNEKKINAGSVGDIQDKMIELTVLSVDGKNENIVEAISNLQAVEYVEIATYIQETFFSLKG